MALGPLPSCHSRCASQLAPHTTRSSARPVARPASFFCSVARRCFSAAAVTRRPAFAPPARAAFCFASWRRSSPASALASARSFALGFSGACRGHAGLRIAARAFVSRPAAAKPQRHQPCPPAAPRHRRRQTAATTGCRRTHFQPRSAAPPAGPRSARHAGTAPGRRPAPRRGVALRRLLLQTLQADRLQVARHPRLQPRGGTGSSSTHLHACVSSAVAALNGGRPVRHSYRIAPRAYTSAAGPDLLALAARPARGPCTTACP